MNVLGSLKLNFYSLVGVTSNLCSRVRNVEKCLEIFTFHICHLWLKRRWNWWFFFSFTGKTHSQLLCPILSFEWATLIVLWRQFLGSTYQQWCDFKTAKTKSSPTTIRNTIHLDTSNELVDDDDFYCPSLADQDLHISVHK